MFSLAQLKLIASLAETIGKWIEKQSDTDEWQEVAGWVDGSIYERMAYSALLPVFQSKADQDYMRDNDLLKD